MSSEGAQYTVLAAAGNHGPRQNPGYRWSGACPHTGSLFALCFDCGVSQLQVQIWNAALWQTQRRDNQSPAPALSKAVVAASQGLGWAWLPPAPSHLPTSSFGFVLDSICQHVRGVEGQRALRETGVGMATEHNRRRSEATWACRKLGPAQDEFPVTGFHFWEAEQKPGPFSPCISVPPL